MLHEGEEDFYAQLVTCDETWLHHHDPESKQQSMEWKHHCSLATRKFKVQKSAGKVMASVFWDKDGLLLIDYLHLIRQLPVNTTRTC